jgi:Dyp-type peroxidase family
MAIFDPASDEVTGPEIDGAPTEPVLDVNDIQGAIIPGFGTSRQHLMALRFTGADALRHWLATTAPVSTLAEVMTVRNERRSAKRADRNAAPPRTPVMRGLALTFQALRLLRSDADDIADEPLRGGMMLRSVGLEDPKDPDEEGHRSQWAVGGTPDTIPHVLLILAAELDFDLDDGVAAVEGEVDAATVVWQQRGAVLPGDIEHFGFRDGVSQVGVRGRLSTRERHFLTRRWFDPADERALQYARPGQPLVWPGLFVFGYPAGTFTAALDPGPVKSGGPPWTKNGSLLVFRRLRQDVAAFRAFIDEESARLRADSGRDDITAERLAACLVGRWPNGSALIRSPDGPSGDEASDMLGINGFGYATEQPPAQVCSDPLVTDEGLAAGGHANELRTVAQAPDDQGGLICPKFAHIRKVNPRDLVTDQEGGELGTRSFQMLRRGITWGKPYVEGEPPENADRGLLFMSYQTDIENQFELLSTRWMNTDRAPELDGPGFDLLVGQNNDGDRTAELHASEDDSVTLVASRSQRWVIPTGGAYLFAPSVSTLQMFTEESP